MKLKSGLQQGAYLLYINGLEIPCEGIDVSYGVWQIPEATFRLAPHWLLQRLGAEDRVEVVVFFLDTLTDPTKPPKFKLMFEGEIVGWSFVNTPHGRQMQFSALADIGIFTALNYHFLSNVDSIAAYAAIRGYDTDVSQAGAFGPFFLLKKGLLVPPTSGDEDPPDVTRPFEILYNAVRGMTDVRMPARQRAVPAVNFFSRWARKRNFINRFFALPLFEDDTSDTTRGVFPILKSAQASAALDAMKQTLINDLGNAGTMWEVLNTIFQTVYCEVMMLPTAPLARVRLGDGAILGPPNIGAASEPPTTEPLRLLNYCVKPQLLFGIAPTCNVFMPGNIETFNYQETYFSQPTRTYVNDSFISGALAPNTLSAAALSFAYPPEADAVLAQKMGGVDLTTDDGSLNVRKAEAARSGKNFLLFPEEFFKGPVTHRFQVPAWFTHLKNMEVEASGERTVTLRELMREYVAYEHFRKRYAQRTGQLSTPFNPFAVPGFPCVILDGESSGMHMVGYLDSINQSMSSSAMATTVSYSMGRTIPEMLEMLAKEAADHKRVLGAAPIEPVPSVRDIAQDFDKAEQFYNALFHQRQPLKGYKKASFDFRDTLEYRDEKGKSVPIQFEAQTRTEQTASRPEANSTESTGFSGGEESLYYKTTTEVVSNIAQTRAVAPKKWFHDVMDRYDHAMQYASRPICSLEEYVLFIHGKNKLSDIDVLTQPTSSASDADTQVTHVVKGDDKFGQDVVYFVRIKQLVQGPGEVPPPEERGTVVDDSRGVVTAQPGLLKGTTLAAQTRADWDTLLEMYREEILGRKAPQS